MVKTGIITFRLLTKELLIPQKNYKLPVFMWEKKKQNKTQNSPTSGVTKEIAKIIISDQQKF